MRLLLAFLALTVGGCSGCASVPPPPVNVADYAYHITMGRQSCSATAVGPNLLLTAEHCLAEGILTINGTATAVLALEVDGADHALLKVTTTFPSWATVGPWPSVGAAIEYTGNPEQFRKLYRRGYVSGEYEGAYVLDINTSHGDSGSGLFSGGQLVGVISAITRGGIRFAAAFPLKFSPEQWAKVS